tara:strand:- start:290 stop:1369 length:1080 start_codon:yes stop_codon:yes gene_type:complete
MSVYVIAEAGVNHNGCRKKAIQLIDVAIQSGADAVKFQTFQADKLVNTNALKADYQLKTTRKNETQYEMLKRLELSQEFHFELKEHCQRNKIDFLSTAFDHESLDFLVSKLKLKKLKIPSGEITNAPLILSHAQTLSDIIVSTGMATIEEIKDALSVIAYGYISPESKKKPSKKLFQQAFSSEAGQKLLKEKVTILQCTSEYPAPISEVNLTVMKTLNKRFNLNVGFSDHTQGINASLAAAALGASIIEKHFTLDKSLDGPDHSSSLEPIELSSMISSIREIEIALGDGIKKPSKSEQKNIKIIRKSLMAKKDIKLGEEFNSSNLCIKRPQKGITPFKYWDYLDKKSNKNYKAGDCIEE